MNEAGIWLGDTPLLLAWTSGVRRTLLEEAGIPVKIVSPGVDERAVQATLGREALPGDLAARLAREKAGAVARLHPDRIVIGADQVLDLDGESLSKPETPEKARQQIARLAGRSHMLHSAVAVAAGGQVHAVRVATARLTVRDLDEAAIRRYVEWAGDAALRSAGGYEVEGFGIHLFSAVDGEHSTILGLPLVPTLALLRDLKRLAL